MFVVGVADPLGVRARIIRTAINPNAARCAPNDLAALRRVGYTDAQIVEIVLHVAVNVLTNYVNEVFKTEVDFPHIGPATRIAG